MENVTSFGESSPPESCSLQMVSRISCAFSAGEMPSSFLLGSHNRHAFITLLYDKMSDWESKSDTKMRIRLFSISIIRIMKLTYPV